MTRSKIALAAALFLSVEADAKQPVPPPVPTEHPDWGILRQKAEGHLRASLYDPGSAQIEWTSGFEWGYAKPIIGRRHWGWIGCFSMNAKNRMGGYVGAEPYWIAFVPDKGFTWDGVATAISQCDTRGKVPLQAELQTAPPSSPVSVADELSKLGEILSKGLITQEEFNQQKAKLLSK